MTRSGRISYHQYLMLNMLFAILHTLARKAVLCQPRKTSKFQASGEKWKEKSKIGSKCQFSYGIEGTRQGKFRLFDYACLSFLSFKWKLHDCSHSYYRKGHINPSGLFMQQSVANAVLIQINSKGIHDTVQEEPWILKKVVFNFRI